MALTDRTVNALLNQARIASNTDVANAPTLAAALDQRHVMIPMAMTTTLAASATYRVMGWVADRNYKVISARFISPMPITFLNGGTPPAAVNVVVNPDNGGGVLATNDTLLAQLLINTTTVGTFQSVALTVQSNNTIAATQRVDMVIYAGSTFNAATPVVGCPYMIDLVVQEV